MRPSFQNLREEFRPMFRLALPVVVAELGWMVMGMVDTLMVGRISPEAIGAVGLGSALSMATAVFGIGLLLGLDTLVSQAFGAGDLEECHRWLIHGIVLAFLVSVPTTAGPLLIAAQLHRWGVDPAVLELARPYLFTVAWSMPPLLLYSTFRRYLQGMGSVRPVMFALVTANVADATGNWLLIFGHWGFPAMGVTGAALTTVLSRIYMAAFLLTVIVVRERTRRPGLFETSLRLQVARLQRLARLGFPAAGQLTLEVGVFALATALAGWFPPAALAAHHIALNIAGFTFMVPLGISSAGAVRVGHAIGRRDAQGAARAGWTALLFGVLFMSAAALAFMTIPHVLIGAFTSDRGVIQIGTALLAVAAVFQMFDGLQGVATGVLRGLGDTRSPMLWSLFAHWFVGLPIGFVLAFQLGYGAVGLWSGLSTGLIICGLALVTVWSRRIRAVLGLL